MVGLTVRDMAASLAFYRLLGLDTPEGAGAEA
ncbi:MAG: glyoxalase, partial [Chloroflexota bacterium]|nr:glyoxalase [Chloroflexota bacterium]